MELVTRNPGGPVKGMIAVDLDGDGSADFAAERQSLAFNPNEGLPAGSANDPSLSIAWTIDTRGPSTSVAALLNGMTNGDKLKLSKGGIIGPEVNAVVTLDGKAVDEFPGMRICGYTPPEVEDEKRGDSGLGTERFLVCGKTDHF